MKLSHGGAVDCSIWSGVDNEYTEVSCQKPSFLQDAFTLLQEPLPSTPTFHEFLKVPKMIRIEVPNTLFILPD